MNHNPSAAGLATMVAAYETASREACEMVEGAPGKAEADQRAKATYDALLALRPTEPAAVVLVLRWRIAEIHKRGDVGPDDPEFLEHAADRLEAMAAQIRAALIGALEAAGFTVTTSRSRTTSTWTSSRCERRSDCSAVRPRGRNDPRARCRFAARGLRGNASAMDRAVHRGWPSLYRLRGVHGRADSVEHAGPDLP
ncbi:MAG: hypothetical protein ACREJ0_25690 [Geminicoccaceae bacterium]